MIFNFKKFIRKNKKIVFKKKFDNYVIIVDRGRYGAALFGSLIASAINHKYEYNVKVLTSKNKDSQITNFYKSFGINDFIYGANLSKFMKNIYIYFTYLIKIIQI